MKAVLHSNLPEFTHTLAEKMMIYALGRGIQSYDRLAIQAIERRTAAEGYKFQTLLSGIVHSYPFQARRSEAPILQTPAAKPTSHAPGKTKQEIASR